MCKPGSGFKAWTYDRQRLALARIDFEGSCSFHEPPGWPLSRRVSAAYGPENWLGLPG